MSTARLLRRAQRGATMVEFAIIASVFFLIVMGIFDFGRGFLYYNMLSNAAREGARAGIISARTSDQLCAVAGSATQLPDVTYPVASCGTFGSLIVSVPNRGVAGEAAQPVRVTITYSFTLITPLIGSIVGDPLTLSASSTMYVEN